MECRETGTHQAIHIQHVSMSLLLDLDRAIESVKRFNGGFGSISFNLKNGDVPDVDVSMRHFRKTKLIKLVEQAS